MNAVKEAATIRSKYTVRCRHSIARQRQMAKRVVAGPASDPAYRGGDKQDQGDRRREVEELAPHERSSYPRIRRGMAGRCRRSALRTALGRGAQVVAAGGAESE